MHGAVEHHGSRHSAQPQCADEGRGLPVPVGDRRPAPMSTQSPAAASRHLGGGAGLVDEDELIGVEAGLGLEPGPPAAQHVRTLLLAGVRRFFEGDAAAVEEAPHGALGDPQPMLALQMGRDLRQHHVRGLFDQRQDHLGPCLDPLRAPVATLWPGPIAACSLPGPNPLDRRRRRDPEALGRSPRRGPGRGHCTLEYPITVCCLGRPYARLEPEQEDRRGTLPESLQAEDASTLPATGAFDEAATGLALLFGRDSARLDLDSACSS